MRRRGGAGGVGKGMIHPLGTEECRVSTRIALLCRLKVSWRTNNVGAGLHESFELNFFHERATQAVRRHANADIERDLLPFCLYFHRLERVFWASHVQHKRIYYDQVHKALCTALMQHEPRGGNLLQPFGKRCSPGPWMSKADSGSRRTRPP